MASYKLFIGCSFSDEMVNLRNYVREQVEHHGSFEPVFGDAPNPYIGPAAKVRGQIATCDAAMIVETDASRGAATPWIYSEIGMAYQQGLPILALVDRKVDPGMTKYAVSYVTFDATKFTESKVDIWKGLVELKNAIEKPDAQSPEKALRRSLARIIPQMIASVQASESLDPSVLSEASEELQRVLWETADRRRPYEESDDFARRYAAARPAKLRIADYVFSRFLTQLPHPCEEEVVVDSGTVTFTICEKLVHEIYQIPIVTNNMAVGRLLSEIPHYPCFMLPGWLECRYLAALGDETDEYLREKLKNEHVRLGLISATSFTSAYGIAGNDRRHASFKKVILEECPCVVLVFEGEKVIRESGSPIYNSAEEWENVLKRRKGSLYVVTHKPLDWDTLGSVKKRLYEQTLEDLRKKLGEEFVIALSSS